MGCGSSTPVDPDERVAVRQTAVIDKMIRMDKKVQDRTVKILLLGSSDKSALPPRWWVYLSIIYAIRRQNWHVLIFLTLGAGESGKSTIIKQMRIIHSGGFPEDERRQNRAVIYSNMVVAFKVLLDIMKTEQIDFENEETKACASPWIQLFGYHNCAACLHKMSCSLSPSYWVRQIRM